ncbi:MAG TPA: rRNA maturation RNase YbeY [Candidatus Acidoferrum sp.]|nr:rRNA maturation RNase YbeY [Candidatus Acidoferrum sp.]
MAIRGFVRRLRATLKLDADFNVCLVSEREIARLNSTFRGKDRPTDVLSFPWQAEGVESRESRVESRKARVEKRKSRDRHRGGRQVGNNQIGGRVSNFDFRVSNPDSRSSNSEFNAFLGDIVIAPQVARISARQEGHSTENEIRWLVLHGVLHLLGYDHATDHGEMTALELSLRERLGIAEESKTRKRWQRANGK